MYNTKRSPMTGLEFMLMKWAHKFLKITIAARPMPKPTIPWMKEKLKWNLSHILDYKEKLICSARILDSKVSKWINKLPARKEGYWKLGPSRIVLPIQLCNGRPHQSPHLLQIHKNWMAKYNVLLKQNCYQSIKLC